MDEQEKAFKEYEQREAAKNMSKLESEIQAQDPFYKKQLIDRQRKAAEERMLRELKKEGFIKPPGQEVKKRKTGKNTKKTARYTPKKKNYQMSPRPVRTTETT